MIDTARGAASRPRLDVPELERRVRRARRAAFVLTLLAFVVIAPLAANYGKTWNALVQPPAGWEPWLRLACALAVVLGALAAFFARRASHLADKLPRPTAGARRAQDTR
jgi:hypothetical protein